MPEKNLNSLYGGDITILRNLLRNREQSGLRRYFPSSYAPRSQRGGQYSNSAYDERERKLQEIRLVLENYLREQKLEPKKAVLLAGGAMYAHGMRDNVTDIDFFHPDLKKKIKTQIGEYQLDGGPGLEMGDSVWQAEDIGGLRVQTPDALRAFYGSLNRPKDREKIKYLDAYLSRRSDSLRQLLRAKAYSDRKQYEHKNRILRKLIAENPQEWVVDDDSSKYYGLTHIPTKFKIHADRNIVTSDVPRKVRNRNVDQSSGTALNPAQRFIDQAELMGSRGRARMYGREEPVDSDYDYIVFTDNKDHQQALRDELVNLSNSHGYKLKERPDGFLTASGNNSDLSFYPTAKKQDIYRSWELQENGVSKDDAWKQVELERQGIPLSTSPSGPTVAPKNLLSGALQKLAALKPEVSLQDHQQRVVDRVEGGDNRLLLYHGLGSGKSLSAIAAAEAVGGDYSVVVPASLRQNFEKEIDKFTDNSNPEVISYTGLGMGKKPKNRPNTLIFDEAHRLRNADNLSSVSAEAEAKDAKNLLLLTGTPITNSPTDLANLLSLLNNRKITEKSFKAEYIGAEKVPTSFIDWLRGRTPGEELSLKNEDQLRSLLAGKVDYQPGKTPEGVNLNEAVVRVPLSKRQEVIQRAIKAKIPSSWAWKLDEDFPLTQKELANLNAFLTGLRQVSLSTYTFRGDNDALKAFQESEKLQIAMNDLKKTLAEDDRKKAIIYSNYIDAGLKPYAAALEEQKIPYGLFHGSIPVNQRKKILEDFNEGRLKALLLGPAGAEGISTKGTSLIQLLDPHWNESRLSQAKGRGLRFDSHLDLPEELKDVEVRRYISESKNPTFFQTIQGLSRERTGDEILETLSARKEKLNEQFRKILREEGSKTSASRNLIERKRRKMTKESHVRVPALLHVTPANALFEKEAKTALVKAILAGKLSPASIQRAAAAMPLGKFRTLNNMGHGQFSDVSRVIGNIRKDTGGNYAGLMARKVGIRNDSNYAADMSREMFYGRNLNKKLQRLGFDSKNPAIAEYLAVNHSRLGVPQVFQRLSDYATNLVRRENLSPSMLRLVNSLKEKYPHHVSVFPGPGPNQAKQITTWTKSLHDIHSRNVGTTAQGQVGAIHDFGPSRSFLTANNAGSILDRSSLPFRGLAENNLTKGFIRQGELLNNSRFKRELSAVSNNPSKLFSGDAARRLRQSIMLPGVYRKDFGTTLIRLPTTKFKPVVLDGTSGRSFGPITATDATKFSGLSKSGAFRTTSLNTSVYGRFSGFFKQGLSLDTTPQVSAVYYSDKPRNIIKSLDYETMFVEQANRQPGKDPEEIKQYVANRQKIENRLKRRLRKTGKPLPDEKSFTYMSLDGFENLNSTSYFKHTIPLDSATIDQTFFDFKDGHSRPYRQLGLKGLKRSLAKWERARDRGILRENFSFLENRTKPRIEVITAKDLLPENIEPPVF